MCSKSNIIHFWTFFVLLINYSRCSVDPNIIVKTDKGKIQGVKEVSLGGREFHSFLGVPFAKPPIGQLRFKDPVEPDAWEGTLQATAQPEGCLQYSMISILNFTPTMMGKEDCLYLNVFTPNSKSVKSKPVMVFIHGGGFQSGGASEYPPYVLMDEDIVLVVVQYRLNVFGFLSTGDGIVSGNYGLKDQNLALRWIKKNIASFGGDPDNVTIFGESAGAASVHYQMLSPWSKGLFNRVIAQSGMAFCPWAINYNPSKSARDYGKIIGCSLECTTKEYLECLRNKEGSALLTATLGLAVFAGMPIPLAPTIDMDFVPDIPAKLIKEERYNKVDLMSGINREEGAFVMMMLGADKKNFDLLKDDFETTGPASLLLNNREFSSEITEKAFHHYFRDKLPDQLHSIDGLLQLYSDVCFKYGYDLSTRLHSRRSDINVYRYEFHHRGQFSITDISPIREEAGNWVSHFDDLFYLFEGGGIFLRTMEDPKDLQMRKNILKLWTNFAKFGNPTPDDSHIGFQWTPATSMNMKHLRITTEPKMISEDPNRKKIREFLNSLPFEENEFLEENPKEEL